jgi:hypothetical protein
MEQPPATAFVQPDARSDRMNRSLDSNLVSIFESVLAEPLILTGTPPILTLAMPSVSASSSRPFFRWNPTTFGWPLIAKLESLPQRDYDRASFGYQLRADWRHKTQWRHEKPSVDGYSKNLMVDALLLQSEGPIILRLLLARRGWDRGFEILLRSGFQNSCTNAPKQGYFA